MSVKIPKLSMSSTDGVLAEWVAKDGEAVEQGQILYLLETDKTAQEIEAPASGTLRIIGIEGETYDIGEEIAVIE